MATVTARDRLTRLVDLATQESGATRYALVSELAELLLDWPSSYPSPMREPFESLLERAIRDVNSETRRELAERFVGSTEMPVSTLNLLVFDASPETRHAILLRNAASAGTRSSVIELAVNEVALVAAIRKAAREHKAGILACRFGIDDEKAAQILEETSGAMLAVLCKGAGVRRATFSALAVLALPAATADENYRRLAAYDSVAEEGAAAILQQWRAQARTPAHGSEAA